MTNKLNVRVTDDHVEIDQGLGHVMRLPRAFLIDLIEALWYGVQNPETAEEVTYFYQTCGLAFGPRSCKLILFTKGTTHHTVASFRPSTVTKLIEGLLPHVDPCYLSVREHRDLLALIKK